VIESGSFDAPAERLHVTPSLEPKVRKMIRRRRKSEKSEDTFRKDRARDDGTKLVLRHLHWLADKLPYGQRNTAFSSDESRSNRMTLTRQLGTDGRNSFDTSSFRRM
jgi:hypothetical protein